MKHLGANTGGAILAMLGMALISVNDMLVKELSATIPAYQIVFVRSLIAGSAILTILLIRYGVRGLATPRPVLNALRALLVAVTNLTFFVGLTLLPLAITTAVFFVAPFFIVLLSAVILGQPVGPRRLVAVLIGLSGVLLIVEPWNTRGGIDAPWAILLPLVSALAYAAMQILTRLLGGSTSATAMTVYIHGAFVILGALAFVLAGNGQFMTPGIAENPALDFLFRPWSLPGGVGAMLLLATGVLATGFSLALTQAYRIGDPATIAPFEYVAVPLALLWGYLFFEERPGPVQLFGIALIAGAGLYVFVRERRLAKTSAQATKPA